MERKRVRLQLPRRSLFRTAGTHSGRLPRLQDALVTNGRQKGAMQNSNSKNIVRTLPVFPKGSFSGKLTILCFNLQGFWTVEKTAVSWDFPNIKIMPYGRYLMTIYPLSGTVRRGCAEVDVELIPKPL